MSSSFSLIYHCHWAGDSCDRRILGFTGPQAFLSMWYFYFYMNMSSSFTVTSGNVFFGALPHLFPNLSHFYFSTTTTEPQTDLSQLGFFLFLQLHTSTVFNTFNIFIYLPYHCLQMSYQAQETPNIETRADGKGKVTCK
ncbi:hypothetical protein C8J56DRAFT_943308 [Mycena floridula]|nr:hypothetical protein C8J56DRAFT_943308 [Mycena floridula]